MKKELTLAGKIIRKIGIERQQPNGPQTHVKGGTFNKRAGASALASTPTVTLKPIRL